MEHRIFEDLVPAVSPPLKKHIRLGHAGIMDHSVDLSIPVGGKEKERKNKKTNEKKRKKNQEFSGPISQREIKVLARSHTLTHNQNFNCTKHLNN